MKTIKVRPILVESKEKIHINSIVLHAGFGLGQIIMDSEEECFYNRHKSGGSITTPWKRNLKGRLLHYDLVLISLDPDEKIEKGDWFVNEQLEGAIALWQHNGNIPNGNPKKVIATQLSPKLMQTLINQYNDGGMKDFEIEMVDKYIDPSRLIYKPKLSDGFIIPIEKQYPIGGFAPGNYENICVTCKSYFLGDKLARQCERCATLMVSESSKRIDYNNHYKLTL